MRALVTGAGGFVGSHLCQFLEAEGHEVVRAVRHAGEGPGLVAELTDRAQIQALLDEARADVVFHLAAQSHVGQSLGEQLTSTIVGAVQMATHLAHGLADRGHGRLVFVSSGESYGRVAARGACEESWVPEPLSPYGAGKRAAEEIVLQAVRSRGLHATIARPFNHLGRRQSPAFLVPSLARQMLANAAEGEAELQVGDLSTLRDYSDVRDIVAGYLLLAERGEPGGIYNLCSGVGRTGFEIVERLAAIAGIRVKTTVDPTRLRAVDVPRLVGAPGKMLGLGWTPRRSLDETLAEVLADARGQPA
jgi:GDP-4-dehydro-6-deoxy-D-mannose reductase